MIAKAESGTPISAASMERISYVKQMLAELSQVARAERADLLAYLLEMAFTEAADLLTGAAPANSRHVNRNEAARMAMKPSGKVQFE
jgi:3-keto-L-gulonate-6-phosphate decarboxylase